MYDTKQKTPRNVGTSENYHNGSIESRLSETGIRLRSALAPAIPLLFLHGLCVNRRTGGATTPTVTTMRFGVIWLLLAACVYVAFTCVGVILLNFRRNESVYKPCEHIYILALAIMLGLMYALVLKRHKHVADFISGIISETALLSSSSAAAPPTFTRLRVTCIATAVLPPIVALTAFALKWYSNDIHCKYTARKVPTSHRFGINYCYPAPSDDNPDSSTNPKIKSRLYHYLAPTAELYPSTPPIYGLQNLPTEMFEAIFYLYHFVLVPGFLYSLTALVFVCVLLIFNFRCLKLDAAKTQQDNDDVSKVKVGTWDPRLGPQLAQLFDVDAFLERHQALATLVGQFDGLFGGLVGFWSLVGVTIGTYLLRTANFHTYTATHFFLLPIVFFHLFTLLTHIIATAAVNRQVGGSLQQFELIFHEGDGQERGNRTAIMQTIALKNRLSLYLHKMTSNTPLFTGAGFYVVDYSLAFSVLVLIGTYTMMTYGV